VSNFYESTSKTSGLPIELILVLLLEISALAIAVIWISNRVIISPTKVLLRTLDGWKAGDRTLPMVTSLDEIGDISRHIYATLQALDESNQQVRDITKAINHHAIVSIADKNGKITYVNDRFCETSKYTRAELIGKDHKILNSGYHSKDFMKNLWDTIKSGNIFNEEIKNRAKDGSEYWVATTIVPFMDQTGEPTQFISIRTDITATKATEAILRENEIILERALEAAEAATYAKSQFLANMSHEIRTPLTSIIGFAEAAREHGVTSEERIISLDRILNSGKHLLGVINDILDLSKIDAGALKVETQQFSPVAVVENVRTLMLPRIAEKGLTLTINYSWPLPAAIHNDSLRLMQILVNLVSNAIKFTDRGEVSVSVLCDREQRKMYFCVADTGIGISPEEIERLFMPFSQTDIGATRRFGGTGLGLYISKSLVKMLGGDISVTSRVKSGSTFSFYITTDDLSQTQWISAIPHGKTPEDIDRNVINKIRGHILIVDDSEENRALLEFSLRNSRISITTAENGQEAVEKALSENFDLIIMDMQMPVMDGYEATRTIRHHGMKVPIIAFTAAVLKNDLLKCTEAGCTSYLAKPFDQTSLIQCLSKYLDVDPDDPESPKIEITRTTAPVPDARAIHLSFVNGLEKRMKAISEAYDQHDLTGLRNAAHKLAGTAGLFGYPALARISAQLEIGARENDLDLCRTTVDQISSMCTDIIKEKDLMNDEGILFNGIGQNAPKEQTRSQH